MRRVACLAFAVALAGCGPSSGSAPLAHALAALRAGDYQDFLKAKDEAAAAVKTVIQQGDDLCKMTMMDVGRYSDVARIARLDNPELFKLPKDDRFVYAFKVAGGSAVVEPNSFLAQAPLVRAITDGGKSMAVCHGQDASERLANMAGPGAAAQDLEEARGHLLLDWSDQLKQRYGETMSDHMRQAVAHLDNAGFSAQWPPQSDLNGYATLSTFEQVRNSQR